MDITIVEQDAKDVYLEVVRIIMQPAQEQIQAVIVRLIIV
jgi:hypothetical protein